MSIVLIVYKTNKNIKRRTTDALGSAQLSLYEVIIFVENKPDSYYCIFDKYNNVNIVADCLGTGLLMKANLVETASGGRSHRDKLTKTFNHSLSASSFIKFGTYKIEWNACVFR